MKKEDKELLLKDLCARLPYGVKVQVDFKSDTYSPIVCKVCSVECAEIGSAFIGVETSPDTYNEFREFLCKPYLFPLSSMTEEQESYLHFNTKFRLDICNDLTVKNDEDGNCFYTDTYDYISLIDWLNKNHFDYRGLIEKGLAIDATGLGIYK